MASKVDLTATGAGALNEANDETVRVVLTTNQPSPGTALNLTGKTLEAFLKPSAATADGDSSVWKGTTASEITVTDAPNGKASIAMPASAVVLAKQWWRLDVISAGLRKTAVYGAVAVTDL